MSDNYSTVRIRTDYGNSVYRESAFLISKELADEVRKCLPHITDPSVKRILEKVANCYPEEECK